MTFIQELHMKTIQKLKLSNSGKNLEKNDYTS